MPLKVQGINLRINRGEIVALMGPNGSGKSSLALGIMGHPAYPVKGRIILDKQDISRLAMDQRVKAGLFLAWQNPTGIRGVTVEQMLRAVKANCQKRKAGYGCWLKEELVAEAKKIGLSPKLLSREINVNFSGGEKKKVQLLELMVLKPKYAILDEVDSGMDADSLKILGNLNQQKMGILLITHQTKVFKYLKPKQVLVMKDRQIVKRGGAELIKQIEKEGYEKFK